MTNVMILTNEHVLETSAVIIGKKVAEKLIKQGYNVRYYRMRQKIKTNDVKAEEIYRRKRSKRVRKIARKNPNMKIFTFHNDVYQPEFRGKPFHPMGEAISQHLEKVWRMYGEMDDFYKHPWIVEKSGYSPVVHNKHLFNYPPNLEAIEIAAVTKPLPGRNRDDGYLSNTVDVEKTEKVGLMSEGIVEYIVKGIQELLHRKDVK